MSKAPASPAGHSGLGHGCPPPPVRRAGPTPACGSLAAAASRVSGSPSPEPVPGRLRAGGPIECRPPAGRARAAPAARATSPIRMFDPAARAGALADHPGAGGPTGGRARLPPAVRFVCAGSGSAGGGRGRETKLERLSHPPAHPPTQSQTPFPFHRPHSPRTRPRPCPASEHGPRIKNADTGSDDIKDSFPALDADASSLPPRAPAPRASTAPGRGPRARGSESPARGRGATRPASEHAPRPTGARGGPVRVGAGAAGGAAGRGAGIRGGWGAKGRSRAELSEAGTACLESLPAF